MKTEFAKAIEAGEDVIGKGVVLITNTDYIFLRKGNTYFISHAEWVPSKREIRYFSINGVPLTAERSANDFEFKHVLDKQKETNEVQFFDPFKNQCLAKFLAEADEENKRLKQQIQMLKDDLFNLQMENARLDLAAQRWQMFDCEANRNIADKLLKKLADEAV